MTTIQVLSPARSVAEAVPVTLAERVAPSASTRLTLIDNGKAKGREILEMLAQELRALMPIGTVEVFAKTTGAGAPLPADVAAAIAARSDLVITAIGDCGACSACSLHDAIQMELHGVPATVLITDVFQRSVAAHAHALGADGYHTVVLPHPVSSRSDERLRTLVHGVALTAFEQLTVPARAFATVG